MEIHYVTILVCAVAAMIIGSIWYGPIFGKMWMRIMCPEAATMTEEQKKEMSKGMWAMYLVQFILSLITAWMLDLHISNWSGDESSVAIAVCAWFGFILTTIAGQILWSGRSKKDAWQMFLVSAGAQLVTFVVFGLLIALLS